MFALPTIHTPANEAARAPRAKVPWAIHAAPDRQELQL